MSEYNNVDNQDSCIEQEIVLQVDNDFGTYNHNALYNKELENQHPIKAITGLTEELELKVDKQEGKDLIDSSLITKLEELDVENIVRDTNYVHTDNNYSNSDRDKLNSIESGAQVNKVNSVNGLIGDIVLDKNNIGLNNVNNTSDLNKPVSNATKIELDKKANKSELSTVAKTGEYKDLINKPTNVSDFNNDTGFITAISSDVLKNKTINASNNIISNIRFENLDVNSTTDEITLTPSTSKLVTENAVSKALSVKANDDEISIVGKTGQYKDLIGEPTNVSAFNNDMGYVVDTDLIPYITTQQVETKLKDYALNQDIPTKTSDLTNDSNFVNNTNLQSELKKKQDNLVFDDIPKLGSNNVVKSGGIYNSLEAKADKTELQSGLNSKQDKLLAGEGIEITAENVIKNTKISTEWGSIVGTLSAQKDLNDKLETKADKSSLSTVATTGSYNDLEDKPDIPVLPENITTQGNSFNKSNQLVQLDSEGRMPAIDGSRLTGIVGQKGDKGDTGATGPSNVLTVGSVTKGVEAEVEITGTSPKQVINFVLPQGEKGDTGAQGPQGLKGDTGEGLVAGGTTGQILAKKSDTDYDTEWIDAPSGGSSEGGIYQSHFILEGLSNENAFIVPIQESYSMYIIDSNDSFVSDIIYIPFFYTSQKKYYCFGGIVSLSRDRRYFTVFSDSIDSINSVEQLYAPTLYDTMGSNISNYETVSISNIDYRPANEDALISARLSIETSDGYTGYLYRLENIDLYPVDTTKTITFELKLIMNTVRAVSFPSSVKWLNDEIPDLSQTGIYYFEFRTDDGGTTWYGNSQGRWSLPSTGGFGGGDGGYGGGRQ